MSPRISYDLWNTREIKLLKEQVSAVRNKEKTMYIKDNNSSIVTSTQPS